MFSSLSRSWSPVWPRDGDWPCLRDQFATSSSAGSCTTERSSARATSCSSSSQRLAHSRTFLSAWSTPASEVSWMMWTSRRLRPVMTRKAGSVNYKREHFKCWIPQIVINQIIKLFLNFKQNMYLHMKQLIKLDSTKRMCPSLSIPVLATALGLAYT